MKTTKSYTYLYPMLAEVLQFKPQIKNIFIGDKSYPDLKDNLFVLYKYHGTKEFIEYEEFIKKNPLYIDSYDPDQYHIMVVFKVPVQYKLDFMRYKASEFSKMSDTYKKKILSFHKLDNKHILYHILYKTEAAFQVLEEAVGQSVSRNNEATSVIDMEQEVYSARLKQLPSISPNEDFSSGKPLIITPKEGLK